MQETIELKLPVTGKTAVLRGYATGRIEQEIEAVYLGSSEVRTEAEIDPAKKQKRPDKVKQISTVDATVGQQATNKTIELMVLSIDGNSENILKQVLDLHANDYRAILNKVEEVTNPDPKEENAS